MKRLERTAHNLMIRKNRIRATVKGTEERPRLSVVISNRNVSAQIINDVTGNTLVAASSANSKLSGNLSEKAAQIGAEVAKKAVKAKISKVVLDRNGRLYQKRLASFANAARENGLEF